MTTVRELITKWVFQADTSAVKAFEGAITAAKNSAKLAAGAIAGITAVSVKTGDALFKLTESIAEQSHEVNRSAAMKACAGFHGFGIPAIPSSVAKRSLSSIQVEAMNCAGPMPPP